MQIQTIALIKQIDARKVALDNKRPFNNEQLSRIKRIFDVDLTYNSNAIEGSTMTFNETKLVINEGLTIGGKKLNVTTQPIFILNALVLLYNLEIEHNLK
jgi:Fic family protein